MNKWKKWITGALCTLMLAGFAIPAQAAEAKPQEGQPPFANPDGMTVDLVYFTEENGVEAVIKKTERTVISAGTTAFTVEMQEKELPEGYVLKDGKDIPLEADMLEVKIRIEKLPEDPTQPTEKPADPSEPSEKPTEPAEKPTEKPTEPAEKPGEKPTEPAEKPEKPEKPTEKPAE